MPVGRSWLLLSTACVQRQNILRVYFSRFYAEMNRLFEVKGGLVVPAEIKGSQVRSRQTVNTVRQCTEGNFYVVITVVQKLCQCWLKSSQNQTVKGYSPLISLNCIWIIPAFCDILVFFLNKGLMCFLICVFKIKGDGRGSLSPIFLIFTKGSLWNETNRLSPLRALHLWLFPERARVTK